MTDPRFATIREALEWLQNSDEAGARKDAAQAASDSLEADYIKMRDALEEVEAVLGVMLQQHPVPRLYARLSRLQGLALAALSQPNGSVTGEA